MQCRDHETLAGELLTQTEDHHGQAWPQEAWP